MPGAGLGAKVTELFYREEPLYEYSTNKFQHDAGHFTQVYPESNILQFLLLIVCYSVVLTPLYPGSVGSHYRTRVFLCPSR